MSQEHEGIDGGQPDGDPMAHQDHNVEVRPADLKSLTQETLS
ncbi:hypothetical protein ACFYNM_37780 [Streptomyces spororaveus]